MLVEEYLVRSIASVFVDVKDVLWLHDVKVVVDGHTRL